MIGLITYCSSILLYMVTLPSCVALFAGKGRLHHAKLLIREFLVKSNI